MSIPTPQSPHTASGMENPAILDQVLQDPTANTVTLVMKESRPWQSTPERLFQVQEKINSYLSFALDGEMTESYPELKNKSLILQLDCIDYPDDKLIDFLDAVQKRLSEQGITFLLRVLEKAHSTTTQPCSEGCGCHNMPS